MPKSTQRSEKRLPEVRTARLAVARSQRGPGWAPQAADPRGPGVPFPQQVHRARGEAPQRRAGRGRRGPGGASEGRGTVGCVPAAPFPGQAEPLSGSPAGPLEILPCSGRVCLVNVSGGVSGRWRAFPSGSVGVPGGRLTGAVGGHGRVQQALRGQAGRRHGHSRRGQRLGGLGAADPLGVQRRHHALARRRDDNAKVWFSTVHSKTTTSGRRGRLGRHDFT